MYFFSGRDSRIHVFRLSDFEGDFRNESSACGHQDLKEHHLERTRGCHMYAISRHGGSHLRMVSCFPFQAMFSKLHSCVGASHMSDNRHVRCYAMAC
jgi:hypothetical protein